MNATVPGSRAALTMRIQNLHPEHRPNGRVVWHCVIHVNGEDVPCDTVHGAWRTTPPDDAPHMGAHIFPAVAMILQQEVRKLERQYGMTKRDKESAIMSATTTSETQKTSGKSSGKAKTAVKKATGSKAKPKAATKAASKTTGTPGANAATERNMAAVLAAVPKGVKEAMNANAVAKKLSDKAGKTVWPIPTKNYLEKLVELKKVKRTEKDNKVLYYT